MKDRCPWCSGDPDYIKYHDEEWGVPVHDDRRLFEKIVLEGAQAGLSWITILKRRENYRAAFDYFDVEKVASFSEERILELTENPGIIRNRLKIRSAVSNAAAFIEVQKEFGSFDSYIWRFTGGATIKNSWRTLGEVPATSPESEEMSRDLKKRGFRFIGPTICYAMMQSIGMVNDHLVSCFRYNEL